MFLTQLIFLKISMLKILLNKDALLLRLCLKRMLYRVWENQLLTFFITSNLWNVCQMFLNSHNPKLFLNSVKLKNIYTNNIDEMEMCTTSSFKGQMKQPDIEYGKLDTYTYTCAFISSNL